LLFVDTLAAIIAYRMLTGRINTQYLLYGMRKDGSRYFSPERVQLLVATIGVAIQYLSNAAHAGVLGKMPDLPIGTLQILGLSNAVYLGGKALAFTRNATKDLEADEGMCNHSHLSRAISS